MLQPIAADTAAAPLPSDLPDKETTGFVNDDGDSVRDGMTEAAAGPAPFSGWCLSDLLGAEATDLFWRALQRDGGMLWCFRRIFFARSIVERNDHYP
jgi:hypothetical protein